MSLAPSLRRPRVASSAILVCSLGALATLSACSSDTTGVTPDDAGFLGEATADTATSDSTLGDTSTDAGADAIDSTLGDAKTETSTGDVAGDDTIATDTGAHDGAATDAVALDVSYPDVAVPSGTATTSAACGSVPILGALGATGSGGCTAAMNTNCCAQATACAADPACTYYRDCLAACTDSACPAVCASTSGVPTTSQALDTCRATTCNPDCNDVACLGMVTWPAPASGMAYTIKWTFYDVETGNLLPGLTVKLCPRADATCASPSTTQTTDGTGSATFTANATADGWDSYLDISGAGIVETLEYQWLPNLAAAYAIGHMGAAIQSATTFSALQGQAGATADPTRGTILFEDFDCNSYGLASVQVSADLADSSTVTSYIVGSPLATPSKTATSTDFHGQGGLFGVKPGITTLTATVGTSKLKYGTYQVPVRAGCITNLSIAPTP